MRSNPLKIKRVGTFGTPSPDGNTYGQGWTDRGEEVELVWTAMADDPFTREDWERFNLFMNHLSEGRPYHPSMLTRLHDPRLKQKLLEAVCKRST
jgi:hypothetical protein